MSLRNVNLNLLPILQMLLKTGSVSRAAAALRLSQPAVSDALSRLRIVLKDQLLVRIGGEMKVTPRATELLGPLEEICASLELFLHPDAFDPGLAVRELVIASADICGYLLARDVIALLREEAPGITLHLIDIDTNLCRKMASREIDFALLPHFAIKDLAPSPLQFIPLVAIKHVVLMWRDHPLAAKARLVNADMTRYPHILFQPDAVITDPDRILVPWGGLEFKVSARVGQMLLVPHLLIGSDSISILPAQLAEAMTAVLPLVTRPVPYGELRASIGLAWSPVYDADPVHKWFRTSMAARLRQDEPKSQLACSQP